MKKVLIGLIGLTLIFGCDKNEENQEETLSMEQRIVQESCTTTYVEELNDSVFVFVPNIMSPNWDGINDALIIGTNGAVDNVELIVTNSGGEVVLTGTEHNTVLFLDSIPEFSTFLSFTLTGTISGQEVNMSGSISCPIFDSSEPITIELENCETCQFGSLFSDQTLEFDTIQHYSALCEL